MGPDFKWDRRKAAANFLKHGVAFAEAASVFLNPLAVIFDDEDHSKEELREIIVGHSSRNRLLVVSYTEHEGRIRIISARVATRRERKDYEENEK